MVSTRLMPSCWDVSVGWLLLATAMVSCCLPSPRPGHRAVSWMLLSARSPGCKLDVVFSLGWRCWDALEVIIWCSARTACKHWGLCLLYLLLVHLPPESLLILTLVMSMIGDWVIGSPMRKCPGDNQVGLEGLSDEVNRVWNLDRPLSPTAMYKFFIGGSSLFSLLPPRILQSGRVGDWNSTRFLLLQ